MIPLTRAIPERIRGGYDDALYKSTFALLCCTLFDPVIKVYFLAPRNSLKLCPLLFVGVPMLHDSPGQTSRVTFNTDCFSQSTPN